MAYQNNIPMATDRLKDSQSAIQDNFAEIETLIIRNHGDFGAPTEGRHTFVEFPTATPTGTTLTTPEVALYSKVGPTSTIPELFFQRSGLTADMGYAFTEGLNAATGYTRLPSGLLVKWGTATSSVGNFDLTYNPAGTPNYTSTPFVCFVTSTFIAGTSATDFDRTVFFVGFNIGGANTFRVHKQNSGVSVPFSYLILGV